MGIFRVVYCKRHLRRLDRKRFTVYAQVKSFGDCQTRKVLLLPHSVSVILDIHVHMASGSSFS